MTPAFSQSKRTLLATLGFAGATLFPTLVEAQLSAHVTGNLVVASGYLDRGVILTNQPVLQPDLSIALPAGGGSATIGGGDVSEGEGEVTAEKGEKSPFSVLYLFALPISRSPVGAA